MCQSRATPNEQSSPRRLLRCVPTVANDAPYSHDEHDSPRARNRAPRKITNTNDACTDNAAHDTTSPAAGLVRWWNADSSQRDEHDLAVGDAIHTTNGDSRKRHHTSTQSGGDHGRQRQQATASRAQATAARRDGSFGEPPVSMPRCPPTHTIAWSVQAEFDESTAVSTTSS